MQSVFNFTSCILGNMKWLAAALAVGFSNTHADSLEEAFKSPPAAAKPGVMWMWMGSNLSKTGISKDLQALHDAGFGRTLMFSIADVTTPFAATIGNSPTPELLAFSEPWWALVRHAAMESKRLGMEFGLFNGPGYETSGGPWVTAEFSMQELCFSQIPVNSGGRRVQLKLERPAVDPRAVMAFPLTNPETGVLENPLSPERKSYYRDIAVIALPADGIAKKDQALVLSNRMASDGTLEWEAPPGRWIVYRFGHTSRGTPMQPAQWQVKGLQCDKMGAAAVTFHLNSLLGQVKSHLGDLIGTGIHSIHIDSYEAGDANWTPKMREEFASRRGYDLTPFLATFADRTVGSAEETAKFKADFKDTIQDLHRDVHFAVTEKLVREAGLVFSCEPYGGPWRQDEVMPHVQQVMTEFWTKGGTFEPIELPATLAALRKSGQNIVEAEAFTGYPADSQWSETPAWLKPMGDAAFCAGVNRFILHRFTHQPWADNFKPGLTMGQWGTHFDRTQTWWEPGKAMVRYWTRCQALLQWGKPAEVAGDFSATSSKGIELKTIHRRERDTEVFFVANLARISGEAWCDFAVAGRQPELWDPVTGVIRDLSQFSEKNGRTQLPLTFAAAQSYFVVFRSKPATALTGGNEPALQQAIDLEKDWDVMFDPAWGGPTGSLKFNQLEDWSQRREPGIKYYSGTAMYRKTFDAPPATVAASKLSLSLGTVHCIAAVKLNGHDLGVA
jgi:alpha-L-rhamnosidase